MTDDMIESDARWRELCQHELARVVATYGWTPTWDIETVINTILSSESIQRPQKTREAAIKDAVTFYYSTLLYAACCSPLVEVQRDVFTALHTHLFHRAFTMASRYGRAYGTDIPQDSAQEAVMQIYHGLDQVREPGYFISWAYKITCKVVYRYVQTAEEIERLAPDTDQEISDEVPTTVENERAKDNLRRQFEEAIRHCLRSGAQQHVIIAHFFDAESLIQIAQQLKKRPENIRQLKRRALKRLQQCEELRQLMDQPERDDEAENRDLLQNASRLMQAIDGIRDTVLSCTQAEAQLPDYIQNEAAGEDISVRYRDLTHHLMWCPDCERLYIDMAEMTREVEDQTLSSTLVVPAPDLSFLRPQSFTELARPLVDDVATRVLQTVAPAIVAQLAPLCDDFFQRVEALGGTLTMNREMSVVLGAGDDMATALQTYTAAYLATQHLASTLSLQELQQHLDQGQFVPILTEAAEQSAQDAGLNPQAAQAFTQCYVDEAQRAPQTWLALVQSLSQLD